jgi:hypothetical protein
VDLQMSISCGMVAEKIPGPEGVCRANRGVGRVTITVTLKLRVHC